jgi:hypothetical protein
VVSIALRIITITDIDHIQAHAYVLWRDLTYLVHAEHISLS